MLKKLSLLLVFVLLVGSLSLWATGGKEKGTEEGPVTVTYMGRMRAEEFGRETFNKLANFESRI